MTNLPPIFRVAAHYRDGEFARAEALMTPQTGTTFDPSRGPPPLWLAMAQARTGKRAEAAEAFDRMEEWHIKAASNLTFTSPGTGGSSGAYLLPWLEATILLREAEELFKDDPLVKGRRLARRRDWNGAAAALGVALFPHTPARAAAALGVPDLLGGLVRTVACADASSLAPAGRVAFYQDLDRRAWGPLADRLLQRETDPDLLAIAVQRLLNRGQVEGAAALCDRWLAREPDSALALRWRGYVHAEQGNLAKAEELLSESVKRKGDDLWARCWLARTRLARGDVAGYRRECAALLEAPGDGLRGFVSWTCCLAPDGKRDGEALVRLARDDVRKYPGEAWAHERLALALVRAGRTEEAVAPGEKAQSLSGGEAHTPPSALLALALAYHHAGQHAPARRALAEAERGLDRPTVEAAARLVASGGSGPLAPPTLLTVDPVERMARGRLSVLSWEGLQLLRREAGRLLANTPGP